MTEPDYFDLPNDIIEFECELKELLVRHKIAISPCQDFVAVQKCDEPFVKLYKSREEGLFILAEGPEYLPK